MLIHTLALLRKTLLVYYTIFQLLYLPIKKNTYYLCRKLE